MITILALPSCATIPGYFLSAGKADLVHNSCCNIPCTIGNYALDRIVSFKKVDVPFCNNTQINFDTYFDDVIGVTVPKVDIETVVLRFSENRFPYIVSKPLHQSQEVNLEERTITIKVKPNKELDQLILSFIPDVEVLSPQSLRDTIKEKIEENLKKYLSAQNTPLNHGTFVQ